MDLSGLRNVFFVCIVSVNSVAQIVQADSIQYCPEPPTSLRRFTDTCSTSSQCVTNFCYQGHCACPANTYYQDCKHSCIPNCGANIRATSGDIVSHGYPFQYQNNQHCTWTLTGNPKTYFVLSITDIDLEGSCIYDSVDIFNGSSPSSVRLAQFCTRNDRAPKVVTTTNNVIHIVFKTDGSNVYRGFSGSYRVDDNNARISQSDFGYIASPGYPLSYPPASYYTWTIEGGQGKFISLRMLTLQVEYYLAYCYDYVEVFDGSSNNSMSLAKICSSYPPVIMSSTSSLHIVFKTDRSNEYSGFAASYQINDCHSTLSDTSGYITSPGFPVQYKNNLHCSWTIIAPIDQVIFFSVSHFQLEKNSNCTWDSLKIYDGRNTNSPLLGTFCDTAPHNIISTSNVMLLVFRTDGSNTFKGFNGTFTTGRPYNFQCSTTSQCNKNLICVLGRCGCSSGFYFNNRTNVCHAVLGHGNTCESYIPNLCLGPSLECRSDRYGTKRCLCSAGMFMNANVCYSASQFRVVLSNDSQISTTEVQLNWTSVLNISAVKYNITWRTVDNTSVCGEISANQNGVHVSHLIPGQEYIFTVLSRLEANYYYQETLFSTDFSIETRPALPGKLNESSSQLMSSPYILRFEPSEGRAVRYRITLGEKIYFVNITELMTDELSPNTQYYYTITAYNKAGDASDVVEGNITTGIVLDEPVNVNSDVNIPLIAGLTSGLLLVVILVIILATVIVIKRKQNRDTSQKSSKLADTVNRDDVITRPADGESSGDVKMVDYRNKSIVDSNKKSLQKNQAEERYYDVIRDSAIHGESEKTYVNIGNNEDGEQVGHIYNNIAFVRDQH